MSTIFDLLYREYCRARLAEMRKQVEYGHDRTLALNITVDVREHHDFQNYYRPNFLAAM